MNNYFPLNEYNDNHISINTDYFGQLEKRVIYFEWKDKKEFMMGSGAFEIIIPFLTSKGLEKSMCTLQPITVGNAENMASCQFQNGRPKLF